MHNHPKIIGAIFIFVLVQTWTLTSSAQSVLGSNDVVVVAGNSVASPQIVVIGTSTITILPGTTVQQVKSQVRSQDSSVQTYTILDAGSNVKNSGAVANGDSLAVTAADGVATYAYSLAIYDASAKARDGLYWNEAMYNQIDQTVNANLPVFRNVDYVITDAKYAALVRQVVDGVGQTVSRTVWYYGDAINAAIVEANANGGGRVVIPAGGSQNADGAYYAGAINMLSNVNLYLATGTTVKFVRNPTNDYYPLVPTSYQGSDFYNYSAPVYALGQTNIAVTGKGTFDAQYNIGNWKLPTGVSGAPSGNNTAINNLDYAHTPIEQRIFSADGSMPATIPVIVGGVVTYVAPPQGAIAYKTTFTPQFIEFNRSKNILIEGVSFINTLFWQVHPLSSQNILIRDITVTDTAHHTDDGIDPESCSYVVMERNTVTVLDDGTAIKSGRNLDGRYRDPSQNLIIRNSSFTNPNGGGSSAISAGSENSGSVLNVFIENNTFDGVGGLAYVLKIKMNAWRGGSVHDIWVRNSTIYATIRGIVNFDTNYNEGAPYPNGDIFNPTMYNIFLDNVNAAPSVSTTFPAYVISSDVSRSPIENVYYRNSVFYTTSSFPAAFSSATNKFFKNMVVDNVTFINPTTHAQVVYNNTATQLRLLDQTVAIVGSSSVPLKASSATNPVVINRVAGSSFVVTGKVDLSDYPTFPSVGSVRIYLDRSTTAIPATLQADGSFTSGLITLNDTQYWYVDPPEWLALAPLPYTAAQTAQYWYSARHYVAVSISDPGINLNTYVYQISDRIFADVNSDNVVTCADLSAASAAVGKRTGRAGYVPSADLDQNGVIDIRDIAGISRLLPAGTHC